jgi:hypothetical protein
MSMELEMGRVLAQKLAKHMVPIDSPVDAQQELAERLTQCLAHVIKERLGQPIFPAPSESLAVSVRAPKTAALAFDRVYRVPIVGPENVPKEVGFYCATTPEMGLWASGLVESVAEMVGIDLNEGPSGPEQEATNLRFLSSEFSKTLGVIPTVFYDTPVACRREFPIGSRQVLAAAVSQIAVVDENQLAWEQVIEFRQDGDVRKKYRRMVRWIDDELKSKSPEEVRDLIALRLDDYEWALKKHGIKTILGVISCVLDPKFLAASSVTVAATTHTAGNIWGALAGTTLAVGRMVLSFGTAYVDSLDERRNYEVAYVYDVRRKFA